MKENICQEKSICKQRLLMKLQVAFFDNNIYQVFLFSLHLVIEKK
jgi:hypothetical protein